MCLFWWFSVLALHRAWCISFALQRLSTSTPIHFWRHRGCWPHSLPLSYSSGSCGSYRSIWNVWKKPSMKVSPPSRLQISSMNLMNEIHFISGLIESYSRLMYTRIKALTEKTCTIIVSFGIKIIFSGVMMTSFVYNYYQYFAMDSQDDVFVLLCPFWWDSILTLIPTDDKKIFHSKIFRFPFNFKTPCAYLVAFTFQYITLLYMFEFIACTISSGIGVYLLTTTMTKDMKHTAQALDDSNKNESMFMKQLCTLISFHASTKQLSSNNFPLKRESEFNWKSMSRFQTRSRCIKNFAAHTNAGVFVELRSTLSYNAYHKIGTSWAFVCFSSWSILDFFFSSQFSQSHDANSITAIIYLVNKIFWVFSPVAIICELCERMSDEFEEFRVQIMTFKWYSVPIEMRKMLVIIMQTAQKPIEFECFGSISCNRETLAKVLSNLLIHSSLLNLLRLLLLLLGEQKWIFIFHGAPRIWKINCSDQGDMSTTNIQIHMYTSSEHTDTARISFQDPIQFLLYSFKLRWLKSRRKTNHVAIQMIQWFLNGPSCLLFDKNTYFWF